MWNKLSTEIKYASSLATLKNLLKISLKINGYESPCIASNFFFSNQSILYINFRLSLLLNSI